MPPSPKLAQLDGEKEEKLNIQDQYINNIRFKISSIDTNMPLKKFIAKQNEKKNLNSDQTQKDIKLYIHNYCQGKIDQNKNEGEGGGDGDEEEESGVQRKGKSRKGKRKKNQGEGEESSGVDDKCFRRFPAFHEV